MARFIVTYFRKNGEFCEKKTTVIESDEALVRDRLLEHGIEPKYVSEELFFQAFQEPGYKYIRLLEETLLN